MVNKKKEVFKPGPMTEGKRNIIQGLLQEYNIETAADIQEALKDVAKSDSLPPTPAEPMEGDEEPMAEFATVIADSGSTVNMRSKATSTAALVERVPLGARVEVLGTCGSWTRVKFGSRTGYMMTKFLTAEEDQEPDEDLTLEERVTRLENGLLCLKRVMVRSADR